MAHGSGARRNWCRGGILAAAIVAAGGCAGKDKTETGMRSMDPRVKAALTTPDRTKSNLASKMATNEPDATGSQGLTKDNSFNRTKPFPPGGTLTGEAALKPPTPGMPTVPANGAVMSPQPKPLEMANSAPPPVKSLEAGPLPSPQMQDIVPATASQVRVPLNDPTPKEPPAIIPPGSAPAPYPPVAPAPVASEAPGMLPVAPTDPGLITIPSPNVKPVTGWPIMPASVK